MIVKKQLVRSAENVLKPLEAGFCATRQRWPTYTPEQQWAIECANAITIGRLVLRANIEALFSSGKISRGEYAIANSLTDMLDKLDGHIIRSNNAANEWGKVFDPYVDKLDFFAQELIRVCRGEMSPMTFLVRFLRDVASTQLRTQAAEGEAHSPAANKWGQASTTIRSASLRIGDMYPHTKGAQIAEHIATVALAVSLGRNWMAYRK